MIDDINNYTNFFKIITPKEPSKRGAQLSLYFHNNSEEIFRELNKEVDFLDKS